MLESCSANWNELHTQPVLVKYGILKGNQVHEFSLLQLIHQNK